MEEFDASFIQEVMCGSDFFNDFGEWRILLIENSSERLVQLDHRRWIMIRTRFNSAPNKAETGVWTFISRWNYARNYVDSF